MRRIAVINQKGGVGKTTTTVNLGAALARLGKRVLICDLDPQCNLTVHVDVDPASEQPSLYELLRGEATLEQAVRPTRDPKLWVLPSSVDLAGVELELVNTVGREVLLRGRLRDRRARPRRPALGPRARGLPAQPRAALAQRPRALRRGAGAGAVRVLRAAGPQQADRDRGPRAPRLNPKLRVTGLLSCRHDSSTNLGRQVMDDIRSHFGDVLLRSAIRRNVKLAEAPSYGRTIFEYDAESRGAQDYLTLARELLGESAPPPKAVVAPAPVAKSEPARPVAAPKVVAPKPAVSKPAVAQPTVAKAVRSATRRREAGRASQVDGDRCDAGCVRAADADRERETDDRARRSSEAGDQKA